MRYSLISILTTALLGVFLITQNCSKVTNTASGPTLMQQGGDGHGYEGKIFVALGQCGQNPTGIKTEIRISSTGNAELYREQCTKLPAPLELAPEQWSLSGADRLIYQSEVLELVPVDTMDPLTTVRINSPADNFAPATRDVSVDGVCDSRLGDVTIAIGSAVYTAFCANNTYASVVRHTGNEGNIALAARQNLTGLASGLFEHQINLYFSAAAVQ